MTRRLGSQSEDVIDDVLRAIAHAPPCAPPRLVAAGSRWGQAGRYEIERRLGRGGMGTVYLAKDSLLDRQVALKVLDGDLGDDAQRARLLREARLAAGIENERVARVYDVGEHDGSTFVAMEYVRGVDLRTWMAEAHTPDEVLAVVRQVAEGLKVLHANGVVHRDLKPENVMFQTDGAVKLLDFGLAGHLGHPGDGAVAGAAATGGQRSSLAFMGTPGYMAPEQFDGTGSIDARADVFALGVMIAEIVEGRRPFRGTTLTTLRQAMVEHTPDLAGAAWARYPARLAVVAARMLRHDRSERYAGGAEVLAALEEPRRRRSRLLVGVAATAVVGAGIAIAVSWGVHGSMPDAPPVPGMALIAGGEIRMGMTQAAADALCAEIGAQCDRERLSWSVPERSAVVAPFYLDVLEVSNTDMAEALNEIRASLVVAPDEDTHAPRYVRFNEGLGHDGEVLLDLFDSTTGVEYAPRPEPAAPTYHARSGREHWPVTQVTLFGAREFCASRGKRLPTEEEWEAAARGVDDRPYPWGSAPVRCGGVRVPPDGKSATEPGCADTPMPTDVGSSPQDVTPDGVHDLGGNVGEWVDTVFTMGGAPVPQDVPDSQLPHITRGGSFAISLAAHTAVRSKQLPIGAGINGGFRCARSVPQP